ncbi:MAG TPA: DUF6443 domain-containing protein, partial [Puia sp.]|nr:DUF6443 domain-containing protein [Puia sp.]
MQAIKTRWPGHQWTALVLALFFSVTGSAQVSISGTNCVVAGGTIGYQYTISGAWQQTDNVTWTIVGGVIAGTNNTSKSGTVSTIGPSISVTWNPGATGAQVQLYESRLGSNTMNVTVTTFTNTLTPASQAVSYGSTVTISGGGAGTGCSPSYGYSWESASASTGPFSPINGAAGQDLTINSFTQPAYYRRALSFNADVVYSNTVSVTIAPLAAGSISASNTSPGYNTQASITETPASGGYCSSLTYEWQQSVEGGPWQPIGSGEAYPSGAPALVGNTLIRRKVMCSNQVLFTNTLPFTVNYSAASAEPYNYIRVSDVAIPGISSFEQMDQLAIGQKAQTTQYFDGLGKPIETVARQASPLQKDLVTPVRYDNFGREVLKYLPYVSTAGDGLYKINPLAEQNSFNSAQFPGEQYYYAQTGFENSPLDRVDTAYAPGLSWVGSSRGVVTQHLVNTLSGDSVRIWKISLSSDSLPYSAGIYGDGLLYKTVTADEQGHQVVEYKDREGKVILKKVQLADNPGTAHVGWLCTYYIYDDLNNLRFVLPPRATELINGPWVINPSIAAELCFRYVYDARNRMVIKHVPGAGDVWMIHDVRDRLVMTQDSNLRRGQQWLVTQYDGLNRPVETGLITYAATRSLLQQQVTSQTAGGGQTAPNEPADTTVATADMTGDLRASRSITADSGFSTLDNGEFTAEIVNGDWGSGGSITNSNVVSNSPVPPGVTLQPLTFTYYDDYAWVAGSNTALPAAMATGIGSNQNYFVTTYNTGPVYAVPVTP